MSELSELLRSVHRPLLCPVCGNDYNHVEEVRWRARVEDQPGHKGAVNLYTGLPEVPYFVPEDSRIKEGRRQRASLWIQCENEHYWSLTFTQHKGTTYVQAQTYVDGHREITDRELQLLDRVDPASGWLGPPR